MRALYRKADMTIVSAKRIVGTRNGHNVNCSGSDTLSAMRLAEMPSGFSGCSESDAGGRVMEPIIDGSRVLGRGKRNKLL